MLSERVFFFVVDILCNKYNLCDSSSDSCIFDIFTRIKLNNRIFLVYAFIKGNLESTVTNNKHIFDTFMQELIALIGFICIIPHFLLSVVIDKINTIKIIDDNIRQCINYQFWQTCMYLANFHSLGAACFPKYCW